MFQVGFPETNKFTVPRNHYKGKYSIHSVQSSLWSLILCGWPCTIWFKHFWFRFANLKKIYNQQHSTRIQQISVQIKVYKHLMAFRCCIEIAVEQFRRGRGDIAVMSLALSCSNPGKKQNPAPPPSLFRPLLYLLVFFKTKIDKMRGKNIFLILHKFVQTSLIIIKEPHQGKLEVLLTGTVKEKWKLV